MVTRYCSDHFGMYRKIKLLSGTCEINLISYANYASIKNNLLKEKKKVKVFV